MRHLCAIWGVYAPLMRHCRMNCYRIDTSGDKLSDIRPRHKDRHPMRGVYRACIGRTVKDSLQVELTRFACGLRFLVQEIRVCWESPRLLVNTKQYFNDQPSIIVQSHIHPVREIPFLALAWVFGSCDCSSCTLPVAYHFINSAARHW